jgi:WD40 repeat protein
VSLLDSETGKRLRIFNNVESRLSAAVLSSNGARLVTSTDTDTVIVWDLSTGQPGKPFEEDQKVNGFSGVFLWLSGDGKRIVTRDEKKAVLTNADTGKPLRSFGDFKEGIYDVAVSSDGRRVLVSEQQKKMPLVLFDAESGKRLRSFATPESYYQTICLSETGSRALTLTWEGLATSWDAETGERVFHKGRIS